MRAHPHPYTRICPCSGSEFGGRVFRKGMGKQRNCASRIRRSGSGKAICGRCISSISLEQSSYILADFAIVHTSLWKTHVLRGNDSTSSGTVSEKDSGTTRVSLVVASAMAAEDWQRANLSARETESLELLFCKRSVLRSRPFQASPFILSAQRPIAPVALQSVTESGVPKYEQEGSM